MLPQAEDLALMTKTQVHLGKFEAVRSASKRLESFERGQPDAAL